MDYTRDNDEFIFQGIVNGVWKLVCKSPSNSCFDFRKSQRAFDNFLINSLDFIPEVTPKLRNFPLIPIHSGFDISRCIAGNDKSKPLHSNSDSNSFRCSKAQITSSGFS